MKPKLVLFLHQASQIILAISKKFEHFNYMKIFCITKFSLWYHLCLRTALEKFPLCFKVWSKWTLETLSFVNCIRIWDSQGNNCAQDSKPCAPGNVSLNKARHMQILRQGDPSHECFLPRWEDNLDAASPGNATSTWTAQVSQERASVFWRTPWMKENSTLL